MYDAVIIGAGPAGSTTAYHAARRGLRVLIVDRSEWPRSKTCGDVLSPRALAALSRMGLSSLPGHPVTGVRIIDERNGAFRCDDFWMHRTPQVGMVIARSVFDHLLLDWARLAGAEYARRTAVRLIANADRVIGVELETSTGTQEVFARTIVAATGSAVSTRLYGRSPADPARRSWGIAGRTYVELSGPAGSELELYVPVTCDERSTLGYAWLFPAGPRRINIGVGVFQPPGKRPVPLRRLVRELVANRCATDPRFRRARVDGAIATAAIAVEPLVESRPGFIPVGDLAGVANPLTGEGIAAALESGEAAATALAAAGDHADEQYLDLLQQQFPRHQFLRPALANVYARPGVFLDRGADLITSASGAASRALRNVAWDEAPRDLSWLPQGSAVRAQVDAARQDAIRSARQMRPLLGELLEQLIAEPDSGFGWHAAFAATIQQAFPASDALSDERRRSLVLVLELLNLVAVLHRDGDEDARITKGHWGRRTLGLMLADTLTAAALKVIFALDAAWARAIGSAARTYLRREADRHLPGKRVTVSASATSEDLFLVSARIGIGRLEVDAVPSALAGLAREVGQRRDVVPSEGSQPLYPLIDLEQFSDSARPFLAAFVNCIHTWSQRRPVEPETVRDTKRAALGSP